MENLVNESWTEISITVDTKDIDVAGDIANMVVPYGIYIEDYSNLEGEVMEIAHIDLIEEELLKSDRTKGIIHVYVNPHENPLEAVSFIKERLDEQGIEYDIKIADCATEVRSPGCTSLPVSVFPAASTLPVLSFSVLLFP